MRISVLGPLAVTEGGRAIAVGGPRQRAVLAFLALHANQVIAGERLVDDLWGVPAPAGAQNALQAAVSRLRKVLPAGRLVTTSNGYLLRLTPGELDLAEFEDALARGTRALAAGAADDAAAVLRAPPQPQRWPTSGSSPSPRPRSRASRRRGWPACRPGWTPTSTSAAAASWSPS